MGVPSKYWLVVEDDDNDFLLFERACRHAIKTGPPLERFVDGLLAKAYLSGSSPRPCLIVSDIKMPGMDGFELLEWVKDQQTLQWIPFVMISNSSSAADVARAKELGADDYQVKPADSHQLAAVVEALMIRYGCNEPPLGP
jgi:CheY-like chemotaxis protein